MSEGSFTHGPRRDLPKPVPTGIALPAAFAAISTALAAAWMLAYPQLMAIEETWANVANMLGIPRQVARPRGTEAWLWSFAILNAANFIAGGLALLAGMLRGGRLRPALLWIGIGNAALLALGVNVFASTAALDPDREWLVAAYRGSVTWLPAAAAGVWLAGLLMAARPASTSWRTARWGVGIAALVFAATFATMQILQYRNLLVPHGDAAMYEEHLWNLLHGKGFRSQLDDGRLFLGEHIEFVHVFLIPFYLLHPSLETLNVCQCVGLGLGAFAILSIGRTLNLPAGGTACLAVAYLFYFPMQMVAHEPTWKTFRPESLGIPLALGAFAAAEARRYGWMAVALFFAFTAKEEYAIVGAALGASLFLRGRFTAGTLTAILSTAYLGLALGWLIPYFRAGAPPHYTPYFGSLGKSPGEIATTLLANPGEFWRRLATVPNLVFLAQLLAPLALLPLFSPRRFLVALPIFGYLMISDLPELKQPWFHFHGPLVPILFWAAVGGWANLKARDFWPRLALGLCIITAAVLGRSPLSWKFWGEGVPATTSGRWPTIVIDRFEPRGSIYYALYFPEQGGRQNWWGRNFLDRRDSFNELFPLISVAERVAATDYVRARFTHHAACHDYPTLRGHVTIDDIDVLVLDKKEGWWGRDPWRPEAYVKGLPFPAAAPAAELLAASPPVRGNPDVDLLDAMAEDRPVGGAVTIRGRRFQVFYHDQYFLAVRRVPGSP